MISTADSDDYNDFWEQSYNYNIATNPVKDDTITFNIPDLPTTDNKNGRWKYNEDVILKEVRDYLGMTYRSHYTSQESKTQTLDLIEGIGVMLNLFVGLMQSNISLVLVKKKESLNKTS